jgi:hypothetical protein
MSIKTFVTKKTNKEELQIIANEVNTNLFVKNKELNMFPFADTHFPHIFKSNRKLP